ncbi:MAG TPA: ABC transporter permease [Bacilli bacterium]|jgi:ABC-type dipeptide/oligopeptide/nickel transport system permease component|nr:ABC transporter permease [Bacilli bacterium]HPK67933.1 ABC transporter permease [Bacilli bacterium]HPY38765.1 ABC transporter permease [Bacilli bacterium]HQC33011.1 ABC transporter permease [Bacilli bacterium]
MEIYLIGYTLFALALAFVVFVQLVSHRLIFKNNIRIQQIFAHPLLTYSIRRIGSALISIMLAITATFFLIRIKSEGFMICKQAIGTWDKLGESLREMQCVALKARLGITENWFVDLFSYYYKILPFPKTVCQVTDVGTIVGTDTIYTLSNQNCRNFILDLGTVFFLGGGNNGKFVLDLISEKMVISFRIGIIAVIVELLLGYPMGIMMAKNKDGIFDKIGKTYIITIDAIPGVAYYYIWMALFAALSLPTIYEAGNFLTYLAPSLTMGFTGMAGIALWVRRFMLDEFNSDYVKFARAKGLSENRIMYTHILRNAIVPLVRSIPAAILGALLGTFYIEKIYGIDGIGGLLVKSESTNDYFVLQGIIVISALISIISYLAGDIVTAVVDPRVSFSKE